MLCCESQTVDAVTGLVSHFNVFHQLNFQTIAPGQPLPAAPNQTLWLKMVASATWQREQGEEGRFDSQVAVTVPGGQENILGGGPFDFTKPFQRIDALIQGLNCNQPGTLIIEIRIRRVGDQGDWHRQTYSIGVEAINAAQPSIN
jgi:hypothetical protein